MSRKTSKKPETPPPAEPTTKAPRRLRLKVVFLVVAGFLVLVAAAGTGYAFYYNNRYLPRTVIGGVAVGGLTRDAAAAALNAKRDAFLTQPLTLTYQDKSWSMKPSDLGTTITATDQLDQMWSGQKGGDWWANLKKLFAAPLNARYADVSVTALSDAGKLALNDQVLKNIETSLQETKLTFTSADVAVVPGKAGEKLNEATFEDAVAQAFKRGDVHLALALAPSQPEVTPDMAEAARVRAVAILNKPFTVKVGSQTFAIDTPTLANWLYTDVARDSGGQAIGLSLRLTQKFTDSEHDWEAAANKNPVNARLAVDAGGNVSVAQPDQDGTQLDENATTRTIEGYLNGTDSSNVVTAVVSVARATVRADTYVGLGLTQLVGTGTTDFSGSPSNRIFNIKKGASSINQVLVKAGDTFSTLDTLGPIDTAHGYLNELVIKDNRTVPDAGGGLCQVSTTLFRSVLNAGLPIVERQNHAYRVSYYERGTGPGLDATIFEPAPDFKWKNDFVSNVFVQSHVEGTKITFDIYGTKDGRVSTISPPTILATYPVGDPIYANTDSLPTGVTKQIEHPHDGAKTSVDYTVTRNGQQIYSKTFISVYKAWPAQYLVGTGPAADPTPPPA